MIRAAVRARRGIALPVALILLAVGGVLAIGTAAAMHAAVRGSRVPAAALKAHAAAASAVAWGVARWRPAWVMTLAPAAARRESVHTAAGDAALTVLRLDAHRFLLVGEAAADARLPGAGARAVRRVGAFVRLVRVAIDPLAALVAGGPVSIAAGASVRGGDVVPAGWSGCPTPDAGVPDLAVALDADTLGLPPGVLGGAGVDVTPAARDAAAYAEFGDVAWSALAARADVVVPAGTVVSPLPRDDDGTCVVDAASWGEPRRGAGAVASCAQVAPVVHLRGGGATRLRGPARLQGILLVDGDLAVEGDVEIAGVVIVRGAVHARDAALRVTGALLVRQRAPASAGAPAIELGPLGVLRHSRCVVTTVTLAASRPVLLGRRAWADVTP